MTDNRSLRDYVCEHMSRVSQLGDGYSAALVDLLNHCRVRAEESVSGTNPITTSEQAFESLSIAAQYLALTELITYVGMALVNADAEIAAETEQWAAPIPKTSGEGDLN